MLQFIYVIKTFATILITNSHFDNLYPVAALSIGGALGNSLFFLASGFCLSSRVKERWDKWMIHCIKRIYPALWSISLLLIFLGEIVLTKENILTTFLFPYNSFWFISAILVSYGVIWVVIKYFSNRLYIPGIITVITYFVCYFLCLDLSKWSVEGASFFKYIFYFGVMLCGVSLRKKIQYIERIVNHKSALLFGATVLSLVIYFIGKILIVSTSWFCYIQFLTQAATLAFGITCFIWMISLESLFKKRKQKFWIKASTVVGSSTLEIYLINYVICRWAEQFAFPVNIVIAMFLILIIGCVLHTVINAFVKRILPI